MARKLGEVPPLVKRLGMCVEAVQNDGDEGKRLAACMAVVERLGEQQVTQSLAVPRLIDSQPGQVGDREGPARELSHEFGRQVAKIDLPGRKRIEPGDGAV